jgi:hypothetical protein
VDKGECRGGPEGNEAKGWRGDYNKREEGMGWGGRVEAGCTVKHVSVVFPLGYGLG